MNNLQTMKRAVFCAFSLAGSSAFAAAPALTTYYWASNETSLVSGSFDNVANWLDSSFQPATEVPGALSLASFYHLPKDEYTVELPEGVYTNYASLQIYSRKGKAVTIDGRGSVFVSPTTETDNYSEARIRLYTSVANSSETLATTGPLLSFKCRLALQVALEQQCVDRVGRIQAGAFQLLRFRRRSS